MFLVSKIPKKIVFFYIFKNKLLKIENKNGYQTEPKGMFGNSFFPFIFSFQK